MVLVETPTGLLCGPLIQTLGAGEQGQIQIQGMTPTESKGEWLIFR